MLKLIAMLLIVLLPFELPSRIGPFSLPALGSWSEAKQNGYAWERAATESLWLAGWREACRSALIDLEVIEESDNVLRPPQVCSHLDILNHAIYWKRISSVLPPYRDWRGRLPPHDVARWCATACSERQQALARDRNLFPGRAAEIIEAAEAWGESYRAWDALADASSPISTLYTKRRAVLRASELLGWDVMTSGEWFAWPPPCRPTDVRVAKRP